jgi:hypothetical protein
MEEEGLPVFIAILVGATIVGVSVVAATIVGVVLLIAFA